MIILKDTNGYVVGWYIHGNLILLNDTIAKVGVI